jgi:hypothetical protein
MAAKKDLKTIVESDDQLTPPVSTGEAEETRNLDWDSATPPPQIDGQNTVNGNPIPVMFATLIPFENTDQGLWARNHGKKKRAVEVKDGPWEKSLQRRSDQPWSGYDPFKEAVDEHREPGFEYRLLSDKVCSKRGKRGWETVTDDKGDVVKVNSMFLGRMPTELKERRNEHYRKQGNDALEAAQQQFALDQEKSIRDAGGQGMSPLRRGDTLTDSRDPDRGASIGFESVRGRAA